MFSLSRWIFLLGLAVVMLLTVSEAESDVPFVGLPCCFSGGAVVRRGVRIQECYEQKPRKGCNHHAFLIISRRGKQTCIDPTSKWLRNKMAKGDLDCRPDVSVTKQLL